MRQRYRLGRFRHRPLRSPRESWHAAAIKGLESGDTGTCEQVGSVSEAKVAMHMLDNSASRDPVDGYAIGLDVELNGKLKRLEVDTGASGLLLSSSAAKAAGLVSEATIKLGGIGDQGLVAARTKPAIALPDAGFAVNASLYSRCASAYFRSCNARSASLAGPRSIVQGRPCCIPQSTLNRAN